MSPTTPRMHGKEFNKGCITYSRRITRLRCFFMMFTVHTLSFLRCMTVFDNNNTQWHLPHTKKVKV